jgi:hypothetical protein
MILLLGAGCPAPQASCLQAAGKALVLQRSHSRRKSSSSNRTQPARCGTPLCRDVLPKLDELGIKLFFVSPGGQPCQGAQQHVDMHNAHPANHVCPAPTLRRSPSERTRAPRTSLRWARAPVLSLPPTRGLSCRPTPLLDPKATRRPPQPSPHSASLARRLPSLPHRLPSLSLPPCPPGHGLPARAALRRPRQRAVRRSGSGARPGGDLLLASHAAGHQGKRGYLDALLSRTAPARVAGWGCAVLCWRVAWRRGCFCFGTTRPQLGELLWHELCKQHCNHGGRWPANSKTGCQPCCA